MSEPMNPKQLIEKLEPAVGALSQTPVELWHLWVCWVLEMLREHANEQEYEEFLARLTLALYTGQD